MSTAHNMRFTFLTVVLFLIFPVTLVNCGGGRGGNSSPGNDSPFSSFIATGGTGSTGLGGAGGQFWIMSTGTAKVLSTGTVDASFVVSSPTPSFGSTHYIVSGGATTTVQLVSSGTDTVSGLYTKPTSTHLYVANGDGNTANDPVVTGLTVNAGATLVLDQGALAGYATAIFTHDVVIQGTVTAGSGSSVSIEARVVEVGNTGKIITSSVVPDVDAEFISLGCNAGLTSKVINRGLIEAKGLGSGRGGIICLSVDELVANYGVIDASGVKNDSGNGGQSGGLEITAKYGDFYSSGIVRLNGGEGNGSGGMGGNVLVRAASMGTRDGRKGDILISGAWELNGGNGTVYGGTADSNQFETHAMGSVLVNATMSAKGGNGTAPGSTGGNSYGITFVSSNGIDAPNPGKIRVAGTFDLRGGDGDADGGRGGALGAIARGTSAAYEGVDVEFVGFPALSLSGGKGGTLGGSGSNTAVTLWTYAPEYPNISSGTTDLSHPAAPITNEAAIEAKGGLAGGPTGTGGLGGYVGMITDYNGAGIVGETTTIHNSGSIDVSGGTGNAGGSGRNLLNTGNSAIYLKAENVTNSGNLTAQGGDGTTTGGDGGNIELISLSTVTATPTVNTGSLSAAGGSGGTTNGNAGTITIDGI